MSQGITADDYRVAHEVAMAKLIATHAEELEELFVQSLTGGAQLERGPLFNVGTWLRGKAAVVHTITVHAPSCFYAHTDGEQIGNSRWMAQTVELNDLAELIATLTKDAPDALLRLACQRCGGCGSLETSIRARANG